VDDPASIFVDVPRNPRWLTLADAMLSSAAAGAAYVGARRAGASSTTAVVAAVVAAVAVGGKLTVLGMARRTPHVSPDELDRIRAAGSHALAAFRAAHPDLERLSWSSVSMDEASCVIRVVGSRGRHSVAVSVYAVCADGAVREVAPEAHPRGGFSQQLERPEATDARS